MNPLHPSVDITADGADGTGGRHPCGWRWVRTRPPCATPAISGSGRRHRRPGFCTYLGTTGISDNPDRLPPPPPTRMHVHTPHLLQPPLPQPPHYMQWLLPMTHPDSGVVLCGPLRRVSVARPDWFEGCLPPSSGVDGDPDKSNLRAVNRGVIGVDQCRPLPRTSVTVTVRNISYTVYGSHQAGLGLTFDAHTPFLNTGQPRSFIRFAWVVPGSRTHRKQSIQECNTVEDTGHSNIGQSKSRDWDSALEPHFFAGIH